MDVARREKNMSTLKRVVLLSITYKLNNKLETQLVTLTPDLISVTIFRAQNIVSFIKIILLSINKLHY